MTDYTHRPSVSTMRRGTWVVLVALVLLSCTGAEQAAPERAAVPTREEEVRTEIPADLGAPSATPAGPAVRLEVGDDFQAVVDAHEPGTLYRIGAGLHRLQQVVPGDGDVFVGETGAVMSGASDISDGAVEWGRDGAHWYVDGQSQAGPTRGRITPGGRDRDLHPEDVFVDGLRYVHVEDRRSLEPGRFFFDYDADRIWLAEDPSQLGLIETSVVPYAFSGDDVADVRIQNLVIERYASPAQMGAVGGERVHGWTLQGLTVRHNHGGGIRIGPGMTVQDSSIVDNGQIGIVGAGRDPADDRTAPVVIRRNEIARNLVLDYDPTWEGGGTKFTYTHAGILVEDNWVHDNHGHGLWFDLHAYNATVRNNLVEANRWRGIFYEISHGPHPEVGGTRARIIANEVRGNGHGAEDIRRGSAIFISNSEDVEVADNWLHDNYGGIVLRQAPGREADTARVVVRYNDLSYSTGCTGFLVEGGYTSSQAKRYVEEADVGFHDNRYAGVPARPFCWIDDVELSYADWADLGHGSDAPLGDPAPPPPVSTAHLADREYGAR